MSSSYEFLQDLCFDTPDVQKRWVKGVIMSAICYGFNMTVFLVSLYYFNQRNGFSRQRLPRTVKLLAYMTSMATFCTLTLVTTVSYTIPSFLNYQCITTFPAPAEFRKSLFSVYWYISDLGKISQMLATEGGLAFIVWRCYQFLWVFKNYQWAIFSALGIIWLTSLAFEIASLTFIMQDVTSKFSEILITAHVSTLFLFNGFSSFVLLMCIISQHQASKTLGNEDNASIPIDPFTSLAESGVVVFLLDLLFSIISFTSSPHASLTLQVLVQVQAIGPALIILRIARGEAWSIKNSMISSQSIFGESDSNTRLSNLRFGHSIDTDGFNTCGGHTLASPQTARQ